VTDWLAAAQARSSAATVVVVVVPGVACDGGVSAWRLASTSHPSGAPHRTRPPGTWNALPPAGADQVSARDRLANKKTATAIEIAENVRMVVLLDVTPARLFIV
jgi:hypothetical protein